MSKTWEMPDGIYTALVTPFKNEQIDRRAWEILVTRQISAGVAGSSVSAAASSTRWTTA